MTIRRAEERDASRVLDLLSQVLEIHAAIRPDIFVPGTTKYTAVDLAVLFSDEKKPVYVAVDASDRVLGYAFCQIRETLPGGNQVPMRSVFIDDLCVDAECRSQGVGKALFQFVVDRARELGCYEITLNVWEGNDAARRFYDRLGMKPKETQMELIL
jgi:ribosomal protein S18 acetylase RimI-like enzyme